MDESSEKVHSVIMLAQIKGSGVTWIKAYIVHEWSSVYRLWIRPESSMWIKIICIMFDRLGEGSPLVWGGVLSGLSRGQPKRCYIEYQVLLYIRIQWILVWLGTTSSQYARMKNRRLKAASTLKRSCSGIREEGCKHSYGGVAQGSRIEEGRPQAFFMLMEEWSGSREKIAKALLMFTKEWARFSWRLQTLIKMSMQDSGTEVQGIAVL